MERSAPSTADPSAAHRGANATPILCCHCHLPVPFGLIEANAERQFCCNGCRMVWQLLHQYGMARFYAICEQVGSAPLQANQASEDFSEFDDLEFQAKQVRSLSHGLKETTLLIEGIHCAACVWLIEKLPQLAPGVVEARVGLVNRTATVRWDDNQIHLGQIAKRLTQFGYKPYPLTDGQQEKIIRTETRRQLLRIGVAVACTGNAMLLAFALYGGLFSGMAAEHLTMLRYASAAVGLLALFWPGLTFFRGAWQACKSRTPHMDVSLSIGLAAGGIMGVINAIRGSGEIYFDSLCMLISVLLVGRFFQFRQQQRAAESVALLRNLTPHTANRVNADGQTQRVPIHALQINDLVEIRAGDLVPADGVIERGTSTLDQSLLSGESAGIVVKPGDTIPAGATNLSSIVRMRVKAIGKATRIGRLMGLVESISLSRVPIVELANRVSGYFLRLVLALALITFIYWCSRGIELALDHTIALLILACPCALGLATPLTIAVAQGRAARRSILIRSGEIFERLNKPGMLWLDKTGTVTEGKMSFTEWHGSLEYMPHVLALERNIVHPLAECLIKALSEKCAGMKEFCVHEQHFQAGRGVRGCVDGKMCLVGTREFLESENINLHTEEQWPVHDILQRGWTPLYIACDGILVAIAAVGDSIRPDAANAVKRLQSWGWQVGLLSGDHPEIVQRVADLLNIPRTRSLGAMLPEAKLSLIRQTPAEITVVMVGDGVNDAAAMAAASVGVAVHGGAEASLLAAPVYLGRPGLAPLVELIQGGRQSLGAIGNGLVVSLGYNLLAISLAMAGYITPLWAAILMPVSSLTVTLLAISQRTFPRPP